MEQLSSLLGSLSLSADKLQVLENVQPALGKLTRQELATGLAGENIDLVPVFDCLASGQPEVERAGCEVLARLLGALDPVLVLERYSGLLLRGLSHGSPRVQSLAVAQLARSAHDEDLAAQLVNRDLVSPAFELLAGDLAVAMEVTNMAVALGETPAGLAALRGPFIPKQLLELMGRGSEVQLRVLEVVVRVAVLGEEHLVAMTTTTLLKPLLDLVQTEDCLAALSAIELLVTLALPPHGQKFLESTGVLTRMARLLDDGQNHPFASILVPGLVKFFGNLAHTRPRQIMMEYPTFVSCLAAMADSEDPVAQAIALETVGYIGVSLEGKLALAELGNRMTDTIDRLELLITDSPTEARIRAMNAFASLIKLDKENQSLELLSLTESWYRRVPSTMARLADTVKQPFIDLRLAAYLLLQVIAGQAWGRREMLSHPGLVETLMDRSVDKEREGREGRWKVVEVLVEGPEVREVLGEQMEVALRLHVKQGPLYVQVQSQVATEGE